MEDYLVLLTVMHVNEEIYLASLLQYWVWVLPLCTGLATFLLRWAAELTCKFPFLKCPLIIIAVIPLFLGLSYQARHSLWLFTLSREDTWLTLLTKNSQKNNSKYRTIWTWAVISCFRCFPGSIHGLPLSDSKHNWVRTCTSCGAIPSNHSNAAWFSTDIIRMATSNHANRNPNSHIARGRCISSKTACLFK